LRKSGQQATTSTLDAWAIARENGTSACRPISRIESSKIPPLKVKSEVTNKVGNVFAQSVRIGAGTIWAIPPTIDNAAFIVAAMQRRELLMTPTPTAPPDAGYWAILHPTILRIAKTRFDTGHYADAVEAALKEVNDIVREIVKAVTGNELDGASLMNTALSPNAPVIRLDDLSTVSGRSIQTGYMQIFAGAMTGIRNPKAHANITISPERAIHLLVLASLLLYKIDERVK
jgi:uncharacterized protein (TIGR02391 family)